MHGACLSHSVFSGPETAVVELLFLTNPPLMFWHATAAAGQRYVMVPLSRSWWLERSVEVPVQDVVDAMYIALDEDRGGCDIGGWGGLVGPGLLESGAWRKEGPEGYLDPNPSFSLSPHSSAHTLHPPTRFSNAGFFQWDATGECLPCPAGTYRPAGAASCMPCPLGRHAQHQGAPFCSTCPAGTFSDDGFECVACRANTSTLFPGSSAEAQCMPLERLQAKLDAMFSPQVCEREGMLEQAGSSR
jgi:hypothetical protein